MAIRFRRVSRLCDPTNKEAGKKVYPVISYQYDTSATLDEFAKEIASFRFQKVAVIKVGFGEYVYIGALRVV